MNTPLPVAPTRAPSASPAAIASARVGALICALAFLTLGWVWAYFVALVGVAFGLAGWLLLRWARRREGASSGGRKLDLAARFALGLAAAVSAVALVATLIAN